MAECRTCRWFDHTGAYLYGTCRQHEHESRHVGDWCAQWKPVRIRRAG